MNIRDRVWRKITSTSNAIIRWPAERYLQSIGTRQRKRYERLRTGFQARYIEMGGPEETTPLWHDFNARVESALLPHPLWDFLRLPVISQTMVMTRGGSLLSRQRQELEEHLGKDSLRSWAREDAFGRPNLEIPSLLTSHNTIHHLYHLSRFTRNTGADLGTMKTIVEWGGGYGNLAKLMQRRFQTDTYVLIDTPLLASLQWLYLCTVLPDKTVNLIGHANDLIKNGAVNIVPVQHRACVPRSCDLFISTWAISESPIELQNEISRHGWFGAQHVLIGYQESNAQLPDAGHIGTLALAGGCIIEDLPVLKGSHYAFR